MSNGAALGGGNETGLDDAWMAALRAIGGDKKLI